MNTRTWARRLSTQLPGWKVWYEGTGPGQWYAVPAPPGTDLDDALKMPYRIGPFVKPQRLREAARERYSDGEVCDTCNCDWRECGYRRDETRDPGWRSMR